jgi:pimeloyl-ACP methyl ester carboxylesterase
MPIEKINGVQIFYQVFGEGEPILFIMGLGSDHSGWRKQIDFFRDKNKVVVFDNRGCGKSEKPLFPYSIKTMATDSIALLDFLKIRKAHLVGVSMGGMIAQEIAINWPERVAKLVIVSSFAKEGKSLKELVKKNLSLNLFRCLNKAFIVDFMIGRILNEEFVLANPDIIAAIKKNFLETFSRIGFINQYLATRFHDTTGSLHLIKSPTLIMAGENDRLVPIRCSKAINEKMAGSRLEIIKGGSHALNWENSEEFNRILAGFIK